MPRDMTCPRCGAAIGPDADLAVCPTCLLKLGLAGDEETALSTHQAESRGADTGPRLTAGQQFGPYRIERQLGRGGMGEAYEAEHVEQGRRVAIKVLNQALADEKDRVRFLREGQLAASVSHPNTVYIFGAEEIEGTPVIVMELVAAGTLKDRVKRAGPMPPAEAVDAILQVIRGLDAAQTAGILHRDIKPSNCFVDRDGTVKIGDFGLSISTLARDVTQLTTTGTFRGTPQFASPEQLKGDPLDVRADIYAVGATLYYLLTGKPPFDATDLMALVARITTEEPRSPRGQAPRVPRGLATLVLKCLAKDPAKRPAAYAALAHALRPFGSEAATPATLGLRLGAGLIDQVIWGVPFSLLELMLVTEPGVNRPLQAGLILLSFIVNIFYFGLAEGHWGRSLGKRLCGLRVTGPAGQPIGYAHAFGRVVLYQIPFYLQAAPYLVLGYGPVLLWASETWWGNSVLNLWIVFLAVLFSTSRRRNGFAGLHDLATGTRVVRDLRPETSRTSTGAKAPMAPVDDVASLASRFGPFDVTGRVGATDVGELLAAFDPTLRRKVWIHVVPGDAPPLTSRRREIGRPGRLRWLGGKRDAREAWDAFEAPDGLALADPLAAGTQPWSQARRWLADLAREIDAGLADGTQPALSLDRIWITRSGRAKLLDFRAPRAPEHPAVPSPVTTVSAQVFLAEAVKGALGLVYSSGASAESAPGPPVPLSAHTTIATLERSGFSSLADVVTAIQKMRGRRDRVSRLRRVASMGMFCVWPAIAITGTLFFWFVFTQMVPDAFGMSFALTRLDTTIERSAEDPSNERYRSERQALEIYVAGRYGTLIADENTWLNPMTASLLLPRRDIAERALADHPNVSDADLASIRSEHAELIRRIEQPLWGSPLPRGTAARGALVAFAGLSAVYAVGGLLTALLLRVGLTFRLFRTTIVTQTGQEVDRWRALVRTLVAWSPLVLLLSPVPGSVAGNVPLVCSAFAIGIAWAIAHPERGIQDRIAGTWLVPR